MIFLVFVFVVVFLDVGLYGLFFFFERYLLEFLVFKDVNYIGSFYIEFSGSLFKLNYNLVF